MDIAGDKLKMTTKHTTTTTTTPDKEKMNHYDENVVVLSVSELSNIGSSCNERIGFAGNESINMQIAIEDVEDDVFMPPDGGWGWVVVLGVFVIMFIVDGICMSFGLFLDDLQVSFGELPKIQVMFAGSLITGMYLLMGPLSSALCNQFGYRKVILLGSGISTVSLFLSSFAMNVAYFVVCFGFFTGMGFGLIFVPSSTIIALWFSKRRAMAMGIAVCGSGCGVAIFSLLIPRLIDQFTWRGCVILLAAINANCFAGACIFRPIRNPGPKVKVTEIPDQQPEIDTEMEKMITDYAKKRIENTKKSSNSTKQNHLFNMVLETKERDRAKSTGSLNDMVITCDNKLVQGHEVTTESMEPIINSQIIEDIVRNYFKRKESHLTNSSQPDIQEIRSRKSSYNSIIYSQISMPHSQQHLALPNSAVNIFRSAMSLRHMIDQSGNKTPINQLVARKISTKVAEELNRPILKPDLYYSGSTIHLNKDNLKCSLTQKIQHSQTVEGSQYKGQSQVRDALSRLFEFDILKSRAVQLNILANFLALGGYLIPFMYYFKFGMSNGLNKEQASSLLTILGACSTFGRLLTGAVADQKWANCLIIHNVALIIAGISLIVTPYMHTYAFMVICVVVCGFSTSAFVSLKTIVIVDVMGVEKLTTIYGWTTLAMGVAIILATPLLGSFYDFFKDYTITFSIGGLLLVVSGIMSIPIRKLAKRDTQFKHIYESCNSAPSLHIHCPANDVEAFIDMKVRNVQEEECKV